MKYSLVYADPPWQISKIQRRVRPNQITMDYPTMPFNKICEMGISLQPYLENNCVLFLWTIQKYLPKVFEVIQYWGFKYQRVITWDKENGMCLFGFHNRTEFLIFAYRGKLEMYPRRKALPTIITAKSPRHSEKPQIFRDLITPFANGGAN